jgi:hypothetical protein
MAKWGMPCRKFVVPSSGSMMKRAPRVARSTVVSSAWKRAFGWAARSVRLMTSSEARSAADTKSEGPFTDTVRSPSRAKRSRRISAPARAASSIERSKGDRVIARTILRPRHFPHAK